MRRQESDHARWSLLTAAVGTRVALEPLPFSNISDFRLAADLLCGSGTFDVKGFIDTLQRLGFPRPWGVEIISEAHRQRPMEEALVDAHRTTMALFDSLTVETDQRSP